MRPRLALLLAVLFAGACNCDPPKPPPPIGQGDPIGPPDAGDPDLHDSGPLVCADDDQEDNDTRATATAVTGTDPVSGRVCGSDDDFYSVVSSPGCDVDARMEQGDDASGDIDVLMFDPDGALVGSSAGSGSSEAIHVQATKDGAYAVRLRAGSRDDVPYTLTLTSTCASDLACPADDAQEDNDNAQQLAHMSSGVQSQGILCGFDEDWYLVPVTQGCIADAHVDFVHADGDIDFEMYLSDGVTRVANSAGTSNSEHLQKVVTEGGMMYRVFFFSPNANSANAYRLIANETCAGQIACPTDDPFEPNDDRASSTDLFAALDESIGVVCGDDDFYSLLLTQGDTLHATLAYVQAEGDLDLELQDGSGNQLAISQGTTGEESIDFVATGNDFVFLRVFGFGGATNVYRLHVSEAP